MSRSQREKHVAFHQPAEKEVIHNSAVTSSRASVLGVRRCRAATGGQVKKKETRRFPCRLSDSSGANMKLATAAMAWTKAKKTATEVSRLCAAAAAESKIPDQTIPVLTFDTVPMLATHPHI